MKSSTQLELGYLKPIRISLLGGQARGLVWPNPTCTSSVGFLHVPPKVVGG